MSCRRLLAILLIIMLFLSSCGPKQPEGVEQEAGEPEVSTEEEGVVNVAEEDEIPGEDEATGPSEQEGEPAGDAQTSAAPPSMFAPDAPETYPAAPTGLNLPLWVSNPSGRTLTGEPVTSGVPFPQGMGITDANSLRLVDVNGSPIPAQFTPLARWGAPVGDTSAELRWVLLDFQVDLEPSGSTFVFLQEGGPGPAPETAVEVIDEGDRLRVETGATTFLVDLADGSLQEASLAAPLTGQVAGGDGTIYTSTVTRAADVTAGPMRTSVTVKGSYEARGSAILDYTTHFWFYAGSPLVRIFHTVENNTPCPLEEDGQITCEDIGSEGSISFQDVSLVMGVDWGGGAVSILAGGEGEPFSAALDSDFVLYQDSSGTEFWDKYTLLQDWEGAVMDTSPRMQSYVAFRGYQASLGSAEIAAGDHAEGWLVLEGGDKAWSIGVRDFWQQFPKALRADPSGAVEVGLFPAEFGPDDYLFTLRAGEHKTHEIRLAPVSMQGISAQPLFAAAPAEWYINSGEFGLTAAPDWEDWSEHEQYLLYQLETSPHDEGLEHVWDNIYAAIEGTDFYGIFDYGDWPIDYEGFGVSPLNIKYDYDYGMWIQWARSGDMRWFWLAEASDRHAADIDVLHTLHEPRHWSDGVIFGHSYHDEEGFINPHRNYGGAAPDTAYGVPGMLLAYYLTGYPKVYDSAVEVADWIEYRMRNDLYLCPYITSGSCSGEGWGLYPDGLYNSGSRPVANSMAILVAAYRATGDERYLAVADSLVAWADPARQPYIDGPPGGSGDEDLMKPWLMNMYLRSLAYYLEARDEFGLGDINDAAGDYMKYIDWLQTYAWIDVDPIDSGPRAAYPYQWYFDGREGDINDEWAEGNNIPAINNWLYLGADAMAYAYRLTGDPAYLEDAAALFRTGAHDPFYAGDNSLYTETKQMINAIVYGNIFLHMWAEANP